MTLHHGDCVEVMAGMDPESVDAIVTDPPYGLEFMGKEWDRLGATVEHPDDGEGPWGRTQRVRYGKSAQTAQAWHQKWAEAAYRVARPSAYLLAFGGTRTVHRMTCALEDAGWIIRDMLVWAYAQGFPKSRASLKPSWEPIVLARKPGPLRELAIDACRIGVADDERAVIDSRSGGQTTPNEWQGPGVARDIGERFTSSPLGRWPANVVLTDPIFDGGIAGVVGGGRSDPPGGPGRQESYDSPDAVVSFGGPHPQGPLYFDTGTYSRFFLIPKAARSDREPVLLGGPSRIVSVWGGDEDDLTPGKKSTVARQNVHPTVKPVELMRHLVRLVTPTGGTVLDPFAGSGSTLLAAELEGFPWIGIERELEYVAIAQARLNGTQRGLGLPA